MMSEVFLTQTVQKGGCAAKIAAFELREILKQVKFPPADAQVSVDGALFDDAAIYQVSDDLSLVQTLDFFTPIVDTPYIFGQIAAANAISDVFAMGGSPKTALAILAFPITTMDSKIAVQILQGCSDLLRASKVNFVGGHSIDDDSIKFGLSVTGFVAPKRIWKNSQAKIGQKLILTKSLGTGTLTAGLKRRTYSEGDISDALKSMVLPNQILDLLTEQEAAAISAATDVTGFGLMGHAYQMALASQVAFKIQFSKIPVLPKAFESLSAGHLTKAHKSNAIYTQAHSRIHDLPLEKRQILFDPQTSGGLLLSVESNSAERILEKLLIRFPTSALIGEVCRTESDFLLEVV